jgi:hypothetical protein
MAKQSETLDRRRSLARQYTARLREILRSPAVPQEVPQARLAEPSGSRPLPQAAQVPQSKTPALPPAASSGPIERSGTGTHHFSIMAYCLRRPRSRVAQLVAKAQRLAHVNQVLRTFLPPHVQEHAVLVRMEPKAWVVQTDSSAWATRLRYLLPNLRQQLAKQLAMPVPALRIRIVPAALPPPSPPPARRLSLTEATANGLEQAARGLADKRLGAAILRLAKHGRQHSD